MTRIFYLLIILWLVGCGDDYSVGSTTSGTVDYDLVCIDGIEYLKNWSAHRGYFAPHFRQDGSLYLCNGERR